MSTKSTLPPFDPVQAAVDVRAGKLKLRDLPPEQNMAVRQKLRHTGQLRTELLRRDAAKERLSVDRRTGGPLVAALS